MKFKKIVKQFEKGNVCVVGLRGTGKDVLFGNVIARRKKPYISNTYYARGLIPFRYDDIDCAGNNYKNFITNKLSHYEYPFADGTDLYLADAGVYFPSQYCSELNKNYPNMATFQALSRHLGECNFHVNVQNLNRVWDKIREQSDTYIMCNKCKVLFGKIVIQKVTIYDKYQSCVDRVKPCKIRVPLLNRDRQQQAQIYKEQFINTYGTVKSKWLLYVNRSKHDTRVFKEMLSNGKA